MNKEEYEILKNKSTQISLGHIPFLEGTLVYGYTCLRENFHSYIKDEKFHVLIYGRVYHGKGEDTVQTHNIISHTEYDMANLEDLVPNKRAYWKSSSYSFLNLCKIRNVWVPCVDGGFDTPEIGEFNGEFSGLTKEMIEAEIIPNT